MATGMPFKKIYDFENQSLCFPSKKENSAKNHLIILSEKNICFIGHSAFPSENNT